MSSLGRMNEYELRDLVDELKSYALRAGPETGVSALVHNSAPMKTPLVSGYLSVSVDRAIGFHKNCNVWVALETDFYGQFTTQGKSSDNIHIVICLKNNCY